MADPLLDQIAAAPDDDTPRLVWADATGGERGELVVIQCALARGGLARDVAIAHRRREAELLDKHAAAWTASLAGLATEPTFRRGFVERAAIDATVFAERGDALFAAAPALREIVVEGLDDGESTAAIADKAKRMFASPQIAKVSGLRLDRVGRTYETDSDYNPRAFTSAGGDVLEALLASGALAHLRTLEMVRCALGDGDLEKLAASPEAADIRALDLSYQQVENYVAVAGEGVRAILASPHFAQLAALDVGDLLGAAAWTSFGRSGREDHARRAREQEILDAKLFAHPRILQLESLGIAACRLGDASLDALVPAPFARLRRFDISANSIVANDFERLGPAPGFAQLEELVFDGKSQYVFTAATAAELGKAERFPSLKVLRLRGKTLEPDAAHALLATPLARRLEVVDVRFNKALAPIADELRAAFDGVLLV